MLDVRIRACFDLYQFLEKPSLSVHKFLMEDTMLAYYNYGFEW